MRAHLAKASALTPLRDHFRWALEQLHIVILDLTSLLRSDLAVDRIVVAQKLLLKSDRTLCLQRNVLLELTCPVMLCLGKARLAFLIKHGLDLSEVGLLAQVALLRELVRQFQKVLFGL